MHTPTAIFTSFPPLGWFPSHLYFSTRMHAFHWHSRSWECSWIYWSVFCWCRSNIHHTHTSKLTLTILEVFSIGAQRASGCWGFCGSWKKLHNFPLKWNLYFVPYWKKTGTTYCPRTVETTVLIVVISGGGVNIVFNISHWIKTHKLHTLVLRQTYSISLNLQFVVCNGYYERALLPFSTAVTPSDGSWNRCRPPCNE